MLKKTMLALFFVTFGLVTGGVLLDFRTQQTTQEASVQSVIEETKKGVVLVLNSLDGSKKQIIGIGTGFFTDTNTIVTNAHVIAKTDIMGNQIPEISHVFIVMEDDEEDEKRYYAATVMFADFYADIAFLRINDLQTFAAENDYKILKLSDYGENKIGDEIYTIGHPWGLLWSVSKGIISAQYSSREATPVMFWEIDAHVFQGNSGGPMINAQGEVVGINSNMATGPGGSYGFAIPVDFLRKVYFDYLRYNRVHWAYLGVSIIRNTIQEIVPDSAMDLNGLFQVGDKILKVESGDIVLDNPTRKSITYLVRISDPEKEMFITIERGDKTYRFGITPKYKYSEDWVPKPEE